ncbi:tetratricopeptide repeat protein [Caballeronia sp. LZ043]|uniref:tetratricopeptide repeat protein n=1 Tax=Caballeronia sp. LZ043 TaxID=3038569 RepID=UPI0028614E98|nr:tetratricopeptide repeat protein [Caballeronia sp. LZ043]MDR5825181.1 tetratricopeptide repeat protein [Caballeronia sp. LZ043]
MKTTPFSHPAVRRLSVTACCATLAILLGACTTTSRQSVDSRPVMRNSAPSSMSEMRIAETALDSGNIELATSLYEKVVQADPHSVAGLTGLGNTLYAVGDFTRAGVYYDRASKNDANAPAPLIGIARVAMRQRRFDDAIATYRRLLSLMPDDPLASAGLGAALDMSGDHRGAQAVLRQALRKNAGDPLISVNLGLSLVLGGDPREGANVLLDVTRFPAAPPQARQDLALAYGLLGNREAAAEILSRDLPKASVEDNLRYYDLQRELLLQRTSSVFPATPSGSATPAAIPTAQVQTTRLK